jgi:hypothetical protein
MKAVVYKEPYKVAVEDVDDPKIEDPTDAIIKITTSEQDRHDQTPCPAVHRRDRSAEGAGGRGRVEHP